LYKILFSWRTRLEQQNIHDYRDNSAFDSSSINVEKELEVHENNTFLGLEFLNMKPFKVNLPLGQRKDVMNKALLRVIKRFFVLKLRSMHSSPLCKSKSRKASISKKQMSDYYLKLSKNAVGMPTDRNQAYTAAIIQKILEAWPAKLVLPKKASSSEETPVQYFEQFDECCKHYSHKKFLEIVESQWFYGLFSLFV
jgi:hypothetical protein